MGSMWRCIKMVKHHFVNKNKNVLTFYHFTCGFITKKLFIMIHELAEKIAKTVVFLTIFVATFYLSLIGCIE